MKGEKFIMKAFLFSTIILILILFAGICFAASLPGNYNNTITNIEFFPSGARFTFKIEPEEGIFKTAIPGAFKADSIRLINPEAVEGNIDIQTYSRTRWTPPQLIELQAEFEEQTKKVSELNAKKNSLEQTLEFLDELKPEKSNPEQLLNYIKNSQALKLETENALAALKNEISKEQEKSKMLSSELNARRPSGENSFIEVSGRAKSAVEFSAFTNAASWSPKYILNLDTESGDVSVQMFVRANEKTGLDYSGKMTLHTKNPDERITEPSLTPLKVGIKPKIEAVGSLPNVSYRKTNAMYRSAASEMAMADIDTMTEEDGAENESFMAMNVQAPKASAVQETLSDRTVKIHGSLAGDGTNKEFEVAGANAKLKGKMLIMMIPELRSNAWIIASMDESNEKLIPGQAELRVDNHTSGKIMLGEYGESQKKIPFGYAEQITVKKEALVGKTGVSWFSGVSTNGYKLEITNGTQSEKVITVKDRLPIPTDEKIKLDVKRIEPKETERDRENRLTWEITVPAGATVPIIVDYTLSYPSGEELLYK